MATPERLELDDIYHRSNSFESQEEEASEIDFATLFLVARKSVPWIVLLIVLGLTGAYLYLRYTKPVYQSFSVIKIEVQSEAGWLGLVGGNVAENRLNITKLSGEIEFIKSDLIYEKLKNSLNLEVNYYAKGKVLDLELYKASPFKIFYTIHQEGFYNKAFDVDILNEESFRLSYPQGEAQVQGEYDFGASIISEGMTLRIERTDKFSSDAINNDYYFVINSSGALNSYLNQNLAVEIVNLDASTIGISFTDHNALKARDIVNQIDSAYLDQKLVKNSMATAQTLSFLDDQLDLTKVDLQNAEVNMESFVQENRTYDIRADVGKTMTRLEDLEKEKLEIGVQLSLMDEIRKIIVGDTDVEQIVPALNLLGENQIGQEIAVLSDLQYRREKVLQAYKDNTSAVQVLETEIGFVKENILKLIQQHREILQSRVATIDNKAKDFDRELMGMPEKETEFARLKRFYNLYEKFYLNLLDKKVEFGIAKAGTIPDFQILSPATLPAQPVSPDRLIVYAIGLASGIFLGLGLVAGRYFMHDTITNVRELERGTQAPVLGIVPAYGKDRMLFSKLIVDISPKSAISESIRSIRTNLDFMGPGRKKRVISVTSTVSEEGKTFVAVNLAGIIALSDQKVIVLDMDMRKPKVHLAFERENTKGMSTILIEKHAVEECIQQTSIANLDFISAGPIPPNPSELILSPRFDEMLEELQHKYEVVIIDSPPVGMVTDGVLIMRKANIPIYIVRADYSKKAFLKNINKLIRINKFTKLSVILNDTREPGVYGYCYGYGHGYYEQEEKPSLLKRFQKRKG